MTALQSTMGTVNVPTVPATNVGPFYGAPDGQTIRLLVRNLGGATILLSHESSAVNGLQFTSQHFELPAGTDCVIIVRPRQSVFAVAIGGGSRLSFAASEALPMQLGV